MRVIVNQIAGLGQKTGIGHYTTELLRCMREQVAGDEIDEYPKGWLRRAALNVRYHLYHDPNFIPFPSDSPTLVTIHDLSVLRHPEWHPADRVTYFEKNFERGLSQAGHFLAISEFGRQEIIRILNVSPERVTRTYMGIRRGLTPLPHDQFAAALAKLGLPPQYLLYLGTIEPRKNVLR